MENGLQVTVRKTFSNNCTVSVQMNKANAFLLTLAEYFTASSQFLPLPPELLPVTGFPPDCIRHNNNACLVYSGD